MSVARAIFPTSLTIGSVTWNKDSGGTVAIDIERTATSVFDSTGSDQSFTFLGFHSFVDMITVRLHDISVFNSIQIGQHGTFSCTFGIPADSTPTEAASSVTLSSLTAYVLNCHFNQSFGAVSEAVVNMAANPIEYSVVE